MNQVKLPLLHDMVAAELENVTRDYLKHGVALLTTDHCDRDAALPLMSSTFIVRKYLRQVAKELKRPFIVAERYIYRAMGSWETGAYVPYKVPVVTVGPWNVKLPNRKKMGALSAPLTMVAHEVDRATRYHRSHQDHPVIVHRQKSLWHYVFNDTDQFNSWLDYVRTTPECRAALNIT